jgi:hypothetical protein
MRINIRIEPGPIDQHNYWPAIPIPKFVVCSSLPKIEFDALHLLFIKPFCPVLVYALPFWSLFAQVAVFDRRPKNNSQFTETLLFTYISFQ